MNTYAQVAAKIGKSIWFVKRLAQTSQIEVLDLGHRTKLISDEALNAYLKKCKRGSTI